MIDPTKFNDKFQLFQKKIDIEVKGDVQQFLGMNINKNEDQIEIIKTHLIDQIISDMGLDKQSLKYPSTPMHSSCILQRKENEQNHDDKNSFTISP